jgi:phosphoribosyl-ATP pyrophosphohydrolase
MSETIGQALDRLIEDVSAKASAEANKSYTAQLLSKGPAQCAKKLGEEAVELAIAIAQSDGPATASETADLLYHLAVALHAAGVSGADVARILVERRGVSGLDEKASRS